MSDQLHQQILHELKAAKQERRDMKSEMGGIGTKINDMGSNMEDMGTKINNLDSEMKNTGAKITDLDSKMGNMNSEMNNRFDQLEINVSHIQIDVTEVKASVDRIEKNQPKDILAMLETIHKKLDDKNSNSDIGALNKRLFTVESKIERLSNS